MSNYALPDPRHRPRRQWASSKPIAAANKAPAPAEFSLAKPIALPLMAKAAAPADVREGLPEDFLADATRDIRQRFADFVIGTDTALAEKLKADATAQNLDLPDYVAASALRALKGASL